MTVSQPELRELNNNLCLPQQNEADLDKRSYSMMNKHKLPKEVDKITLCVSQYTIT